MWKTIISSITGGLYPYLIVAAISSAITGYATYSLTSDHYIVKMQKASIKAEEEKDEIQRKGDKLVADYVVKVNRLSASNSSLQKQIAGAVGNSQCAVPNGFVRLYNASATGQSSTPSGVDGSATALDLATILSVSVENNDKCNKIAEQLKALQAFENAK